MSIEKSYNLWAEQYDTNKNKTRDLDKIATIKTLNKYSFNNVLELGCGTGKNTIWLLEKAQQIIAVDFSEEMMKKATKKIANSKVTFKKADITKTWEIKNEFADLITSSLILEHIENLDFIFKEAFAKLKPNGLFFICELHPFKQYTGAKARFETETGTKELEVYTHNISEFTSTAFKNGFKILELKEWFDDFNEKEIPRLVSFVFQK